MLWRCLRDRGWSQHDLAEELGTKAGAVNRWLHGDRRPSRAFAFKLFVLLGIKPDVWDEPLSRRFELRPTGS